MWPIHLDLGFWVVHFYEGFYILLSVVAASLMAWRRLRTAGQDAGLFLDGLPWILLGAILGARIFHFLFWDWSALWATPLSFFQIWGGGYSITGGLAGGVVTAYFRFKHGRIDFWSTFASASPALLVGQALGRIGCFLNGDAWGIPTHLPWGVSLPKFGTMVPGFVRDVQVPSEAWLWSVRQGFTDPRSLITVPLHPTQLYEALGDLLLVALILWLIRRLARSKRLGLLVLWAHLGGYSLIRFGLEFLHGDRDAVIIGGMTALQIALLAFAAMGTVAFVRAGVNDARCGGTPTNATPETK